MVERFKQTEANPTKIPMTQGQELERNDGDKPSVPYRELIGSLLYASNPARPDIAFAVLQRGALESIHQGLQYLKSTRDFGLVFKRGGSATAVAYADADWATDKEQRKSTSGYVAILGGAAII